MHTLKWFHNFLCQFFFALHKLTSNALNAHTEKRFSFSIRIKCWFWCCLFLYVCVYCICVCVCNIVGPANRTRRDLPCTHKNQTKAPSARKQLKRRKCASDWETLFHIRRDAESTRRSAALRAGQSRARSLLLLFLLSLGAFVLACSLTHSHTSIWPPSAKLLRANDMLLDVS